MNKFDGQKENVFAMVPKNDRGELIRVARITPQTQNALESIDIRQFYTDSAGIDRPTQKGVRIHEECLIPVVIAVLEAMTVNEFNTVMEHFAELDDTEENNEEEE
jgi:hypothetical protein